MMKRNLVKFPSIFLTRSLRKVYDLLLEKMMKEKIQVIYKLINDDLDCRKVHMYSYTWWVCSLIPEAVQELIDN